MRFSAAIFCALLSSNIFATQPTVPRLTPPDALGILNQVTQKYAEAKSLHIEAKEEMVHSNEVGRNWSKTLLSVTVAPDGRYRYEVHGASGAALLVSNGKTVWTYHYDENMYTEKPVRQEEPKSPKRL